MALENILGSEFSADDLTNSGVIANSFNSIQLDKDSSAEEKDANLKALKEFAGKHDSSFYNDNVGFEENAALLQAGQNEFNGNIINYIGKNLGKVVDYVGKQDEGSIIKFNINYVPNFKSDDKKFESSRSIVRRHADDQFAILQLEDMRSKMKLPEQQVAYFNNLASYLSTRKDLSDFAKKAITSDTEGIYLSARINGDQTSMVYEMGNYGGVTKFAKKVASAYDGFTKEMYDAAKNKVSDLVSSKMNKLYSRDGTIKPGHSAEAQKAMNKNKEYQDSMSIISNYNAKGEMPRFLFKPVIGSALTYDAKAKAAAAKKAA